MFNMTKTGQGVADAFNNKTDETSKDILHILRSEGTINNISDYDKYFTVTYTENCLSDFSCITEDLLKSYSLYIYAIQKFDGCTTLFFKSFNVFE